MMEMHAHTKQRIGICAWFTDGTSIYINSSLTNGKATYIFQHPTPRYSTCSAPGEWQRMLVLWEKK